MSKSKYIFENEYETLFETDDFYEMKSYLYRFPLERDTLEFSDMYETYNYITIHFYGYNLMIRKEDI